MFFCADIFFLSNSVFRKDLRLPLLAIMVVMLRKRQRSASLIATATSPTRRSATTSGLSGPRRAQMEITLRQLCVLLCLW